MDFADSPRAAELRRSVRSWLRENLDRHWRREFDALDESGRVELLRRWHHALYRAGFVGLSWPVEFGGRGMGVVEEEAVSRELALADAPPPLSNAGTHMVGPALIEHGTPEQRRRFLPGILTGQQIWCQGYSEPEAGSDLAALRCRADREPDGGFLVNGQKVWTSRAHVADRCLLLVRTGTATPRPPMCFLLVDMTSPGVRVRPILDLTGQHEFNEVFFDQVQVPAEDLLGPVDGGWSIAMGVLERERRMPSRGTAPSLDAVLADLLALAGERGLDDVQRQALGRCVAYYDAHQALRARLVARVEDGTFVSAEASLEKLSWDETLRMFHETAAGMLGDELALPSTEASRRWLDGGLNAPSHAVAGGTTEMQKNTVARRLLRLPRG